MGAVPEFLLRKLVVPGSLKPAGEGFLFEINNTFVPVHLLRFNLRADGREIPAGQITIIQPGAKSVTGAQVSPQEPFELPTHTPIRIEVGFPPPQKELGIEAETPEAGLLQFSVPARAESGSNSRFAGLSSFFRRLPYYPRILKARLDPQRPKVHFAAPAHRKNAPNGYIYWKGLNHISYQFNPCGAVGGKKHWGPAISSDLIRWHHLPIALAPDPGGADAGGCFSGCAVDNAGEPTFLYTGVWPECQCLAVGQGDQLKTLRKHPTPVIPAPPPGLDLEGFRDPCVWRQDDEWRMVIGSGLRGEGGAILLYRSPDLRAWEYLGILCQGDATQREPLWTGTMWECPSFFPLGDRWVLIISACCSDGPLYTIYSTGEYSNNRFTPDGPARLVDFGEGGCFYAPQTFLDESNRRLVIGWLREARPPTEMSRAGWSGAMAFPRILSLGADGSLRSTPIERVQSLRSRHESLGQPGQETSQVSGAALEANFTLHASYSDGCGIELFTSSDSPSPAMRIIYDPARQMLQADCVAAGGLLSAAPLELASNESLLIRIFLDGSLLEVYAGDRVVISARYYLQDARSPRLRRVGSAPVDVWELSI